MSAGPLTLADLDAIGVERIKGVGDKKLASLHSVDVRTVLDLITTYPRRWVDRTNEARVADLTPGQAAGRATESRGPGLEGFWVCSIGRSSLSRRFRRDSSQHKQLEYSDSRPREKSGRLLATVASLDLELGKRVSERRGDGGRLLVA